MANYKMMDEVVCYCTKCKMNLNHRITRVEGGQPKRVLCLTCKTDRNYRRMAAPKSSSEKGAVVRKPRAPSVKSQQEAEWRANLARGMQTPKKYSLEVALAMDDHIQHPIFGRGLVVGLIPPDKASIFFEDGVKTLKIGAFC